MLGLASAPMNLYRRAGIAWIIDPSEKHEVDDSPKRENMIGTVEPAEKGDVGHYLCASRRAGQESRG